MADLVWTFNGLTFGDGTSYDVISVTGFDAPDLRRSDVLRGGSHGLWLGQTLLGGRLLTFDMEVAGTSPANLEVLMSALRTAFVPTATELPLGFTIPGRTAEQVNCSLSRGPVYPLDMGYVYARASVVVQFLATDPRVYDQTLQTVVASLPGSAGGLTFNAPANFLFGVSTGGLLSAPNSGSFPAPWVATFTGPLTAPALLHQQSGRTLSFSPGSLNVGDTLVVDSLARSVVLNGSASRYLWLDISSTWFELAPGTNTLNFTAASGTGSCSIAWRNTRI